MIESKEPDQVQANAPPPPPQLYTYNDVSRALRVTKQTLMEWVKSGKVSSPKYFGYTARFTAEQMNEMMAGPKPAGTHQVAESPRSKLQKPTAPVQAPPAMPAAAELNKRAMALDAQAVHTARTAELKKKTAAKKNAKKNAKKKKK